MSALSHPTMGALPQEQYISKWRSKATLGRYPLIPWAPFFNNVPRTSLQVGLISAITCATKKTAFKFYIRWGAAIPPRFHALKMWFRRLQLLSAKWARANIAVHKHYFNGGRFAPHGYFASFSSIFSSLNSISRSNLSEITFPLAWSYSSNMYCAIICEVTHKHK